MYFSYETKIEANTREEAVRLFRKELKNRYGEGALKCIHNKVIGGTLKANSEPYYIYCALVKQGMETRAKVKKSLVKRGKKRILYQAYYADTNEPIYSSPFKSKESCLESAIAHCENRHCDAYIKEIVSYSNDDNALYHLTHTTTEKAKRMLSTYELGVYLHE